MNQDAFPERLLSVPVPELGVGQNSIRLMTWLVPIGAEVICGERLAEIITQGILVCVEAPEDGILKEQRVNPGDPLQAGQVLAIIQQTAEQ